MTENNAYLHIQVTAPAELLSIVPRLLGFTPEDSMVVIGTTEPRNRVKVTLRYDLAGPDAAADIAAHAAAVFDTQDITVIVAVGYGPGGQVTPIADALRTEFGPALAEILRVEGGRYWSCTCTDTNCCPAEGTPFSYPASHQDKGALFDYPAGSPVLATRAELTATVAPVVGKKAETVAAAFTAIARNPSDRDSGVIAVTDAIQNSRTGYVVHEPATIARLLDQLQDLMVRDTAWAQMDPSFTEQHLKLWTNLTRYAVPGLPAAAAASLLAFCAWQSGNGALANVALDRALADDPWYSMALLLRQIITAGAPPSMARLPMTPEEVAASYAGLDENDT